MPSANGAAQLKFGGKPNTTTLVAGTQLLYISPDGNFIFGGSYEGYDMFAGVRAATSPPSNYDGLYYQAGLTWMNRPPPAATRCWIATSGRSRHFQGRLSAT